jgi:AraC-like DNA-binding protein
MARHPTPSVAEGLDSSVLQHSVADVHYHAAKSFPEIYACVREGDVENLDYYLHHKDYVEHQKATLNRLNLVYAVYVLCGLCIMCAREGGLPLERCVMIASKFAEKSSKIDQSEDLFEFVCRLHREFAKEIHQYRINDRDHTIAKCRNYVYSNIYAKIDLGELSAFCGYSLNGLQHYFRKKMGITLTQYIRKEKIRKAQFLLRHTDDSCVTISQKLSFCSQSYFIDQFKREMGLTPNQFRKQRD